jgi:hypothetical protein
MKERKYTKQAKTPGQYAFKWLLLAVIFLSRIAAFFSSSTKLHKARFAAIHELENLLESAPDCIFRGKAAGDSWGKRPLIPEQAGHRFHGKSAALANAKG